MPLNWKYERFIMLKTNVNSYFLTLNNNLWHNNFKNLFYSLFSPTQAWRSFEKIFFLMERIQDVCVKGKGCITRGGGGTENRSL